MHTSKEDGRYPSKQTASMKVKIGSRPLKSFHIMHFPLTITEPVSNLSGKRVATVEAAGSNCKVENSGGQNANGATAAVSSELGFPH